MFTEYGSKPLPLHNIKVTDGFWCSKMELVRTEVIPYQWNALHNKIKGAKPSYCIRNFEMAGKLLANKKSSPDIQQETFPLDFEYMPKAGEENSSRFFGMVFQDSDLYKWIEAASYSLIFCKDSALETSMDQVIAMICDAQREDGYLDTYYIMNNPAKIFTNLTYHHELYCFGHLAEAAAAYYEATGKKSLLAAAERFAQCIMNHLGSGTGKKRGYPGHALAEMALFRLYEATGKKEYLELSRYFLNERGRTPNYFIREQGLEEHANLKDLIYCQSHKPVQEQQQAEGHAVRAVYLYSGMAECAAHFHDSSLYQTCLRLWEDITERKMYLTGGIGSTYIKEAFTFAYDLPNDTAYAETCASIGLIFFARRMLAISPEAKYADVMERALYNGVLSGMALDGKSFFYVNPLEVLPKACSYDPSKSHVLPQRSKWFSCACCPPNLARLLMSLGAYAFTESADTLYVHLFVGGTIQKKWNDTTAQFKIDANPAQNGTISISLLQAASPVELSVAVRIPEWCEGKYSVTASSGKKLSEKHGYLYVSGLWHTGDIVSLDMQMEVMYIRSHPAVFENIGKIALQRGPFVYCMEEFDNGKNLHRYQIDTRHRPSLKMGRIKDNDICFLETDGFYKTFRPEAKKKLYTVLKTGQAVYEKRKITWIPYYAWANRNSGEMQVWVREKEQEDEKA